MTRSQGEHKISIYRLNQILVYLVLGVEYDINHENVVFLEDSIYFVAIRDIDKYLKYTQYALYSYSHINLVTLRP